MRRKRRRRKAYPGEWAAFYAFHAALFFVVAYYLRLIPPIW